MSAAASAAPSSPGRPGDVFISFRNVSKVFRTGPGRAARDVVVVDDVNLDVRRGEFFGVIGYSGAGKSTLVRLINGLEPVTSGSLTVGGFEVAGRSETELAPVRRDIGMIFQQFNLFTSRTVAGNVEYPLKRAGWDKERRRARVAELLEFVGLSAHADSYPEQLSGGQKQRVGIARALATSPELLLADESTSALDPETTQEVLQALQRADRELGITVVLITHEMDVVRAIADRVAVMQGGKVVEDGPTVDVFARPRTETARRFVSSVLHTVPDELEVERLRRAHRGRPSRSSWSWSNWCSSRATTRSAASCAGDGAPRRRGPPTAGPSRAGAAGRRRRGRPERDASPPRRRPGGWCTLVLAAPRAAPSPAPAGDCRRPREDRRMGVALFLAGVLLAAAAIAVSIALHEIGHLVPAKLFGVRVTQYMVGFGRTVFSRRRGETEYGLKAIPLGGYISMVGMYPPVRSGVAARVSSTGVFQQLAAEARGAAAGQIGPGDEHRVFYRLPVWKRVVIMLGGPVMNLLLGTVCLAVLLTGFGTPTPTTTVAWVSECVVPAERQVAGQTECTPGDPRAPANEAGLRPGDVVTAVDGVSVATWDELTRRIRDRAGERIPVVVERDGRSVRTELTPILSSRPVLDERGAAVTGEDGSPRYESVGFIGISPTTEAVRQPLTAVPGAVLDGLGQIAGVVLNLPQRVYEVAEAAFGEGPRDPDGPISVVGVGRISGEIAAHEEIGLRDKAASLVGLVGSVNLALFVFNLLPLLPLDGGHVAGALWEGLRRGTARLLGRADPGPFDPARLLPVTYAVAVLMVGMSALLVYADIVKPVQLF